MNALAMTASSPLNALLAMSVAPASAEQSGGFLNLLDTLFDTPAAAASSSNDSSLPIATRTTVSSDTDSQQIANALIRSMMTGASTVQNPGTPQTKTAISFKTAQTQSLQSQAGPAQSADLVPDASSASVLENLRLAMPAAHNAADNNDAVSELATPAVKTDPTRPMPVIENSTNSANPEPSPSAVEVKKASGMAPTTKAEIPSSSTTKAASNSPVTPKQEVRQFEGQTAVTAPIETAPRIETFPVAPAAQPVNLDPAPAEAPGASEPATENDAGVEPYVAPPTSSAGPEKSKTPARAAGSRFTTSVPVATTPTSSATATIIPMAIPPEPQPQPAPRCSARNTRPQAAAAEPVSNVAQNASNEGAPGPAQSKDPSVLQTTIAPPAQSPQAAPQQSSSAQSAPADLKRVGDAASTADDTGWRMLAPVISAPPPAITDEAPVAFNVRLTPLDSDFSPVPPLTPRTAAGETAIPQPTLSSAAEFVSEPEKQEAQMPAAPQMSSFAGDDAAAQTATNHAPAPKSHDEQGRDSTSVASEPAATPAATMPTTDVVRVLDNTFPLVTTPADKPAEITPVFPASPAPVSEVAQTLRTSEPNIAPASAPASSPVQNISVRIPLAGAAPVDLQVSQRSGEIRVSVRTSDPEMQTTLRQDLGTLSSSLERAGYRADVFTSRDATATTTQETAQTSSNLRDKQEQPGSGGRGGSSNPQERQQQQSRNQRQKTWLEEMENSK